MIRLSAFVGLAVLLAGYAFWVYQRAELPVRRGTTLAVLRALSLVLLLALIFDVRLPWGGEGRRGQRWALLDVSSSMSAGDGSAWQGARERARALEDDGWSVVSFGGGVVGGTPEATPAARHSALEPALVRALEAGVSEVRVLSDTRFEDPVATAAALAASRLDVSFESFGSGVVNAGVGAFSVQDQGRRGETVDAEVEFFAEGTTDSVQVEIREEGELVLSRAMAPPTPGRRARVTLELPAPDGEGRLRYSVRMHLAGDAFSDDDEGVAYMTAGHEEGGLVVVSLSPDWEPRALFTVLAEATGMNSTGYLRAGPDRFVPMGRAVQRGAAVDSATVRAAASDAALLVLHGLDAGTDAWGRSLARRPGRVLLWPGDAVGADLVRAPAGAPLSGEWYAATEIPTSPVAGDLAGARLQDLPPLGGLLPLDASAQVVSPIRAQLGGTGPGRPVLILDDGRQGRRAVSLASGYWRWEARDGAGRDAYRRLWSGVAGWLLAQDPQGSSAEVRPARWTTDPEARMAWWIPGETSDSVRLEILGADGEAVVDTTMAAGLGRTTRPLAPGLYRYRAEGADGVVGEGRFDVEARSDELLHQPRVPDVTAASIAGSGGPAGSGRPLRSWPWPYLLVLLLLSAEWVGRRRAGLR